jgi:RHS repeat-associated protein
MKTPSVTFVWLLLAVGGCGAVGQRQEAVEKSEGAITGCAAKSVTTVATVAYEYDLAGRQTRDRDARLLYDPWNHLKEVQLITTTSPKYNDGRTVVAEKFTYGFDGIRTSTTTNPGAANGAVRVQISPDDVIHDGKREHYVRIGDRIVSRLAMTASGTLSLNDSPATHVGAGKLPAGLQPSAPLSAPHPWPVLGLAILALGVAALETWRLRRRWAPTFAAVALLAASCQMFGEGLVDNPNTLLLAEKVYFHTSLGAGPSLITRQDGTILEERRFEPFGVPIDAYRSGRTGSAPVDLVTDPQSIVGKQADATNGFTDHGARWLSPPSARWLTPDPAGAGPATAMLVMPWRLNPYAYVGHNPMKAWDPTGNYEEPVHGALTYQLALAAGFDEGDAAKLALMTAGVDHNQNTQPVNFKNIVTLKTRDIHFASPSVALERVTNDISKGGKMDMVKLGTDLHTLEDVGFDDAPGPHHDAFSPLGGHRNGSNEDGSNSRVWNHHADQAFRNPEANSKELHRVFDVLVKAAEQKYGGAVIVDRDAADSAINAAIGAKTVSQMKNFMRVTPDGAEHSYLYYVDQNDAVEGDFINGTHWSPSAVDATDQ